MQLRPIIPICFLALLAAFFMPGNARASHAAGGEIVYEWLSGSKYKIIFKFYRDCSGAGEPEIPELCYRNTCTNQIFSSAMSKAAILPGGVPNGSPVSVGCIGYQNSCLNPTSTIPGYREWWYLDTITLPSKCSAWKISAFISARNPSNNLSGLSLFYVEAMLNNDAAPTNTSAYFSVKPVPYVCVNQPYTFNNGAVDINNDSLAFEVMLPQWINDCVSTPMNCVLQNKTPPLGLPSNPFQTNNTFSLDAKTGALSFTPGEQGPQTVTIRANEYRKGVLIGSVMRDIQVQVLNYSSTSPTVDPNVNSFVNCAWVGGQVQACAGAPFSFCFDAKSADSTAVLIATDNHAASIPAASMDYTNQLTDSVRGCFHWTPGVSDTGLRLLVVTVLDSTCDPPGILFSQAYTIPIYIWPATSSTPEVTFNLPDSACVGQHVVIEASKKGLVQYIWETAPATIVEGAGGARITVKWESAGRYGVSLRTLATKSCVSLPYTDSITIRNNPRADIVSVSNYNVCVGDTISVRARTLSGYSYEWQPAENADHPHAPATVIHVTANMVLMLVVKDDICYATDTALINSKLCCDVLMPNVFTPNGDGLNDVFRAINRLHNELETFIVCNRFGEIVFQTADINQGWDGTYRGQPADVGTYFYYLKYTCAGNEVYRKKGDVILMR
jgi:gliding motility-associated-like protein